MFVRNCLFSLFAQFAACMLLLLFSAEISLSVQCAKLACLSSSLLCLLLEQLYLCFFVLKDVLELLEKRVKSRFSHRQINLCPSFSFDEYISLFQSYLMLPTDSTSISFDFIKQWNQRVQVSFSFESLILHSMQVMMLFYHFNYNLCSTDIKTGITCHNVVQIFNS